MYEKLVFIMFKSLEIKHYILLHKNYTLPGLPCYLFPANYGFGTDPELWATNYISYILKTHTLNMINLFLYVF